MPPVPTGSRRNRRLAGIVALLLLAACGDSVRKADAYEALADTLYANGAFPAAVDALTKANKQNSNEPRRWLKLGRSWRALGNPALSAMSYQRALELDPASMEALQNLAVLSVRSGQFDEAKQYVDPLLMLNPDDPGGLLAAGAIAYFEKRYGDADRIAGQIIQIAPDVSEGYVLRARVLESRGDGAGAARLLAARLALDPDSIELATQLLGFYQRSGDLQGIRTTALTLARLKPDDVSYQMEAARAHHAAGREDEARAILARLLARFPGSPGMTAAVAQYWEATLPRDQAAQKIAEMAVGLRGRALAHLSARLVALGRADAAVRLLAPGAAAPVDANTIDAQSAYAEALFALGRYDDADAASLKVIMYDQNDIANLVRAKLAARQGKWDEALTSAQGVRSSDPQNEEAALLVPRLFDGAGKPVLARSAFGDAEATMPDNLNIVMAHAAWLFAHGLPEDAAQVATRFATAHPRMGAARDFARSTCRKAKTNACILAAGNTRHPWNL